MKNLENQLPGVENPIRPEDLGDLGMEGSKTEQDIEQPELSPEEKLKGLEGQIEAQEQEIAKLTESIEGTKSKLSAVREGLGLPPTEEDPSSITSEKDTLEKLQREQEELEKQKEEIISEQEKEELIKEEKEKILQEKLDGLFKEFEGLNPNDLESILRSGKTSEGNNVESKSIGSLKPEDAQSLMKVFKEGIKLLPKIIEALPELLKKLDEDLEKEATERVEKRLEEEKKRLEDERNKEEITEEIKPEGQEEKVPPNEIKQEIDVTENMEEGGI